MATANVAIVDERDPLVRYTGTWNDAGAPLEFKGTTRWSSVQGSTASFSFVGTSVTVFGTVAAVNPPQAALSFLVDKTVAGSFAPEGLTADVHHTALWASPPLADGPHTLVVTQTAAQAAGVLFLDYIMWNTTAPAPAGAYFIDDRDARVVYTPPWRLFGSDPDFMHTSQATGATGDALALQFDGTAIEFYGGINNATPGAFLKASMRIDSGAPVVFEPGPQPAAVTTNNLLFASGKLAPGTHRLTVTALNEHAVWADYFLVTPNPATFSSSSSASRRTSSSTSGAAAGATSSGATSGTSGTNSTNTAAAVASVVVVIVLLILLGVALFLRRRRRRNATLLMPPMASGDAYRDGGDAYPGPGSSRDALTGSQAEAQWASPAASAQASSAPSASATSAGGAGVGAWAGAHGAPSAARDAGAAPAHYPPQALYDDAYAGLAPPTPPGQGAAGAGYGGGGAGPLFTPLAPPPRLPRGAGARGAGARGLTLVSSPDREESGPGVVPSGKLARYETPPQRESAQGPGWEEAPPGYAE
ncbi:hypothetical protein B0H15DRAFT_1025959 [Mycena belliarum]|uniref:Uncharacterized protein n=1 Tax=Mycena belliarum TaxID=1033014 RepID=A0AAD6TVM0_9AGAR|nr:hypothetical protein B0H15DRAFT_1025959 [Mycena belliae]